MTIDLTRATREEIPVLRSLMQFYLYDIASLDHWDLREDGAYGNPERIESFWVEKDYDRFLIRVDGVLAGFAITSRSPDAAIHVINEFFVLRRYRRSGVGRAVARRLFEGHDGTWYLTVMRANVPAQDFWASVISDLTGKDRCEFTVSQETDEDIAFRFSTARPSSGDVSLRIP